MKNKNNIVEYWLGALKRLIATSSVDYILLYDYFGYASSEGLINF